MMRRVNSGQVNLLISPSASVLSNNIKALKFLTKKTELGVYITINQPYVSLKRLLDQQQINSDKLFFIDLISSTVSSRPERFKDVLFINSPTSITELGIAIVQLLASMPEGEKFVFIDNLSAFLIYNNMEVISEFAHFLITKMRLNNVIGLIMTVNEADGAKLVNIISPFCDQVVRISDDS